MSNGLETAEFIKIYKVLFSGHISKNADFLTVKENIKIFFKADSGQIDFLFSPGQVTLKTFDSMKKAMMYKALFERTGAICSIVEEYSQNTYIDNNDNEWNIINTIYTLFLVAFIFIFFVELGCIPFFYIGIIKGNFWVAVVGLFCMILFGGIIFRLCYKNIKAFLSYRHSRNNWRPPPP